jgi:hypothetical protein
VQHQQDRIVSLHTHTHNVIDVSWNENNVNSTVLLLLAVIPCYFAQQPVIVVMCLHRKQSEEEEKTDFILGKRELDGKICRKKANKTHSTKRHPHINIYIEISNVYLVAHMFLQPAN